MKANLHSHSLAQYQLPNPKVVEGPDAAQEAPPTLKSPEGATKTLPAAPEAPGLPDPGILVPHEQLELGEIPRMHDASERLTARIDFSETYSSEKRSGANVQYAWLGDVAFPDGEYSGSQQEIHASEAALQRRQKIRTTLGLDFIVTSLPLGEGWFRIVVHIPVDEIEAQSMCDRIRGKTSIRCQIVDPEALPVLPPAP